MKNNILITGADGNIGKRLIKSILSNFDYNIIAVVLSEDSFIDSFKEVLNEYKERITVVQNDKFVKDFNSFECVYAVVHLAFARGNRPANEIASSIEFATSVFNKLINNKVNNIINISSQSVYGSEKDYRDENTLVCPDSLYAMAKFASELILKDKYQNHELNYTNIRLDSIVQSQNLIKALCKKAKANEVIKIVGPNQYFSYLDIEDAVSAVMCLLITNKKWRNVYNVGLNCCRYSLVELAEMVSDVALKKGYNKTRIKVIPKDIELYRGVNSSQFISDTGWKPKYNINAMVERIFNEVN